MGSGAEQADLGTASVRAEVCEGHDEKLLVWSAIVVAWAEQRKVSWGHLYFTRRHGLNKNGENHFNNMICVVWQALVVTISETQMIKHE